MRKALPPPGGWPFVASESAQFVWTPSSGPVSTSDAKSVFQSASDAFGKCGGTRPATPRAAAGGAGERGAAIDRPAEGESSFSGLFSPPPPQAEPKTATAATTIANTLEPEIALGIVPVNLGDLVAALFPCSRITAVSPRRIASADEYVLVGIVQSKRDLQILQNRAWYRIPVSSVRSADAWPPQWFAAYETQAVSGGPQQVLRFAEVKSIDEKSREELFPEEFAGARAGKRYFQLHLGPLQTLPLPLIARRPRRNPFIRTTLPKLLSAEDINDLFDDSPFEDDLWRALRRADIPAERQWHAMVGRKRYVLDFAVFCQGDNIDIEVDGPRHHHLPEQSEYDSDRNNELTTKGWDVLRFTTRRVSNKVESCIAEIAHTINRNGGPDEPHFVPKRFVATVDGLAAQLSLFEGPAGYDASQPDTMQSDRD
jgi:very-short-patch-repair endonuclease